MLIERSEVSTSVICSSHESDFALFGARGEKERVLRGADSLISSVL